MLRRKKVSRWFLLSEARVRKKAVVSRLPERAGFQAVGRSFATLELASRKILTLAILRPLSDGKELISLPNKSVELFALEFSQEEREM